MNNRLLGIWLGVITLLLGALVLLPPGTFGARSAGAAPAFPGDSPRMVVPGQGRASAQPNVAKVTVGVETLASNVTQAVSGNQAQMTSVVAALKAAGIESRDIQTSSYSIYPQRDTATKVVPAPIVSYRVTNTINVTVRRLETISQVLDQAISAGANNVSGLRFTIDDPRAMEDQARAQALEDAKRKAESLAKQAGLELGPVLQIADNRGTAPMGGGDGSAPGEGRGGAGPIEAGEQQVTWNVEVTYSLR